MNNTIEAAQPTVARSAAKNILGVGRCSVEKIAISAARSQPFSLFRGPRVEIQLGPALVACCPDSAQPAAAAPTASEAAGAPTTDSAQPAAAAPTASEAAGAPTADSAQPAAVAPTVMWLLLILTALCSFASVGSSTANFEHASNHTEVQATMGQEVQAFVWIECAAYFLEAVLTCYVLTLAPPPHQSVKELLQELSFFARDVLKKVKVCNVKELITQLRS